MQFHDSYSHFDKDGPCYTVKNLRNDGVERMPVDCDYFSEVALAVREKFQQSNIVVISFNRVGQSRHVDIDGWNKFVEECGQDFKYKIHRIIPLASTKKVQKRYRKAA